jgi:transposase
MYESCVRVFGQANVVLQHEFRTSMVCPECKHFVEHEYRKLCLEVDKDEMVRIRWRWIRTKEGVDKTWMLIRGLLFCPECSKHLSRDKVGSLNIGDVWRTQTLRGLALPEAFLRSTISPAQQRRARRKQNAVAPTPRRKQTRNRPT